MTLQLNNIERLKNCSRSELNKIKIALTSLTPNSFSRIKQILFIINIRALIQTRINYYVEI